MSKIVRVQSGDYKIITVPGGTITLDTGFGPVVEPTGWPGGVIINGDLLVNGATTVIESSTLSIKDNIIYINEGETGPGVSLNTSGIQIDRGAETDVSFLWDERIGAFVLVDASYLNPTDNLYESALALGARSILTGGSNLTLIGSNLGNNAGSLEGVVDVIGTVGYEEKILNYSLLDVVFEIVKVERVGNIVELELSEPHGLNSGAYIYVSCSPFPQLSTDTDPVEITKITDNVIQYFLEGDNITPAQTFFAGFGGTIRPVSVRNDDYIPNMKAVVDYTAASLASFSQSSVINKISQGDSRVIVTDNGIPGPIDPLTGLPTVQISQIRFDIDSQNQVVINNNGLFVDSIQINNSNIKNNTQQDNILIDSVLELKVKPGDPSVNPGYVSLYSKPVAGSGGTGLFFVDNEGTRDELISKTKSLLYSLIL